MLFNSDVLRCASSFLAVGLLACATSPRPEPFIHVEKGVELRVKVLPHGRARIVARWCEASVVDVTSIVLLDSSAPTAVSTLLSRAVIAEALFRLARGRLRVRRFDGVKRQPKGTSRDTALCLGKV